jgi:Tol biopolymer transport system component
VVLAPGSIRRVAQWMCVPRRALFLVILSSCSTSPLAPSQEPSTIPTKHYKVTELGYQPLRLSPDGRYLSHEDEDGDFFLIRDLKSGADHPIPDNRSGPLTFRVGGKQIDFDWGHAPPATFSRKAQLLGAWFHDWSPDRKHVAATFLLEDLTYQLGLVAVSDGSVRVLKTQPFKTMNYSFQWVAVRFSPDGRFIAYDLAPQGGWHPRDIFAVPVEGGPAIPLVDDPANDLLFGWTPDGKNILFVSDRSGAWDLWRLPLLDGRPLDPPTQVLPHFGIHASVGFAPDGSYFYTVLARESDLYLTALDPATGRLGIPEKLLRQTSWNTTAEWSRDGQYLVYASGIGSEYEPFVLGIRTVRTGEERQFRLDTLMRHGGHGFEPRWSPDGRFILATARERDYAGPQLDSQGLYRIDTHTGSITPLVRTSTICGMDCLESPLWSPDGKVIFKRRATESIVTRDLQTGQETEIYRAVPPAFVVHWPTSNMAISPDGQRLVFVLLGEGVTTLNVIPTAGGDARELFRAPQTEVISVPAWMPNSRDIVFARNVTGEKRQFELWRVSVDGGKPQNLGLTMRGLQPYGLSIHPDGRRIVFTAGKPPYSEIWGLKDFQPLLKTATPEGK